MLSHSIENVEDRGELKAQTSTRENPGAGGLWAQAVHGADGYRRFRLLLHGAVTAAIHGRRSAGTRRPSVRFVLSVLFWGIIFTAFTRGLCSSVLLYHVQEVKPSVFVWTPDDVIDQECDPLYNRPATAGFVVTSQGVVVVDSTNSPINGRDLLYEIRQRTPVPVRYVINTSSAPDHVLGNEVFADQQAIVTSSRTANLEMQQYHRDLLDRMKGSDGWRLQARMRGFHVTPSTQTFDSAMTLNFAGEEFRISTLLGGNASSNDSVVFMPSAKVLFLGELFDNHYFPRVGTRDVRRWIEVLRQVETWDVDVYIPGHGAPGSRKDVEDFRKFLEWTVAQIEMRVKQGKPWDDVKKDLWLPRTYNWHAPDLAPDTLGDIYRQIAPPPTAPPPSFP